MNSVLAQLSGRAAAIALAVSVAACSVDGQNAPPLTGPSGFGQTVTLSASPDQLPRDGASRSTVTISVRNEVHQPVAGQRLAVSANAGTISASDVITDSSGNAVVTVTAPPSSTVVASSGMAIFATPVGTDSAPTSATRSIAIALTGVRNTTAPVPAFTMNPGDPSLLQSVVLDASGTQDEGAACQDVCTYTWDFGGEAQATGRVVTYQFRTARIYPVTLTVQDAAGTISTLTQNVTVVEGAAPTASFTFSPTAPAVLEQVNFSADASAVGVPGRTIASYEWQFGDGTTGSGRNVTKAYAATGAYVVTLTVTDSAGLRATTTQTVTVSDGITAAFSFSPTDPNTATLVVFNASTSRPGRGAQIVSYVWNFGDSTTVTTPSTSPLTSHTFGAPGTYTVVLTVTDSAGRSATTSLPVTVQ